MTSRRPRSNLDSSEIQTRFGRPARHAYFYYHIAHAGRMFDFSFRTIFELSFF